MAYIKRLLLISLVSILQLKHKTTVNAQLLDPVNNYCARFDHQCEHESRPEDHDVS